MHVETLSVILDTIYYYKEFGSCKDRTPHGAAPCAGTQFVKLVHHAVTVLSLTQSLQVKTALLCEHGSAKLLQETEGRMFRDFNLKVARSGEEMTKTSTGEICCYFTIKKPTKTKNPPTFGPWTGIC